MGHGLLAHLLAERLASRQADGLLRSRRCFRWLDAVHVEYAGRSLVHFCSNDYLGLSHHPRVVKAVQIAAQESGAGAGASALICGYSPAHQAAESAIARWKNVESSVLLPSGYQAALAAVQTLAHLTESYPAGVRFLIDKLAHASLIDAIRGVRAPFRVFPHNHMVKLDRLLADSPAEQLQIVVTESIFSMDGDAADLPTLASLKAKYGFVLLLDEAHGSGVYGPAGAGYAAELSLGSIADVSIVTLSKAVGLAGGAICGSNDFCQAVVNFGRSYIYSTAMPPAIAAGIQASIEVMRDEPQHQQRVRQLATRVRKELGLPPGDCPIIPIILGQPKRALDAASALEGDGLLVAAVRPPTVPPNTSRLRVTLSCAHTDQEAQRLVAAIMRLLGT